MKRWLLLPAIGAALYGLARGLLEHRAKGVADDAKTRASVLPNAPPARRRSPAGRSTAKIRSRDATRREARAPRRKSRSRRDATQPPAIEPIDSALEEHLALRAKLGAVLDVIVGVHANADGAELDVHGIDARTQLRVRPTNLRAVLDRATAVFDRDSTD
jgi:hypothetical protein